MPIAWPISIMNYDRGLAALGAALTSFAREEARQAGKHLSLEQAVEMARTSGGDQFSSSSF
jgi:hypothetical protein